MYRYNPELIEKGKNPLQLDSKAPTIPFEEYAYSEIRFRSLIGKDPVKAKELLKLSQEDCNRRWKLYSQLATMDYSIDNDK